MYALRRHTIPSFYGTNSGERGGLTLLFLAWIVALLLLVFGGIEVARHEEAAVALDARLDVCAVSIASEREKLLASLVENNRLLETAKIAVYALRGVSIVGKAVGALAEEEILAGMRALVSYQDGLVLKTMAAELPKHLCKTDAYSTGPALCLFPNLSSSDFRREETLFPDVPGRLRLRSARSPILELRCAAILYRRSHVRKLELRGDPALLRKDYSYAYKPES